MLCKKQCFNAVFLLCLMGCNGSRESKGPRPAEIVQKGIVEDAIWEDLKIQRLLPNFIVLPAIEPYLPGNFVAVKSLHQSEIYWGPIEVLENFVNEKMNGSNSSIIKVNISLNISQKDSDSFVNEENFEKELRDQGANQIVFKKWKWRDYPVLSCSSFVGGSQLDFALLGLNQNGETLIFTLLNPSGQKLPNKEAARMWNDFLEKTKPLNEQEFVKVHGQDLRQGLTLVNLNGSILQVYGEKRIRDNKIQMVIKSIDEEITCKCLTVSQGTMGLAWHLHEPLVKLEVELQTTEKAKTNISQHNYISVLLKQVNEFSLENEWKNTFTQTLGPISVLNFCPPLTKS